MFGIDISKISRFKNKSKTFVERVLHEDEIIEYINSNDKEKFLCAHFSIKEAIFKADNKEFPMNTIKILKVNRVYQYKKYIITTSNEDDLYVSLVIKKEKYEN